MTSAHTLRNRVTSEARGSDQARGSTITARLDDGPLQGIRIEGPGRRGSPAEHRRCHCRRRQHVPLLPRGVGPERSVADLHVPLSRVAHAYGVARRSEGAQQLRDVASERFGSVEPAIAAGLALHYDDDPCLHSDTGRHRSARERPLAGVSHEPETLGAPLDRPRHTRRAPHRDGVLSRGSHRAAAAGSAL